MSETPKLDPQSGAAPASTLAEEKKKFPANHSLEATDDHEVSPSDCPGCRYRMDRASNAKGEGSPDPGSLSVCLNCGRLLIFDADLRLRKLTAREVAEAMSDREAWAVIEKIQAIIRERGLLHPIKKNGVL